MGLVGLVCFLNGINMGLIRIGQITNGVKKYMERLFLTVDGKKFANIWNENKRHMDIHFALHAQRYDNPLAPMFNVGVYVQQAALRNLRCSHTLAFCAVVLCQHWMWGGEGALHRNCCMSDCVNAFCELFSINSPLEHGHALQCGMNARQLCEPIQHKTRGKWMRSFFGFYVLMFEHTLFSRRGCTTQRKAHHRETIPAQKAD